MKVGYEKPAILFEDFELNTAIASGCGIIVTLGPGDMDHKVCDDYVPELPEDLSGISLYGADTIEKTFYENNCSCELSAGNGTLLTS